VAESGVTIATVHNITNRQQVFIKLNFKYVIVQFLDLRFFFHSKLIGKENSTLTYLGDLHLRSPTFRIEFLGSPIPFHSGKNNEKRNELVPRGRKRRGIGCESELASEQLAQISSLAHVELFDRYLTNELSQQLYIFFRLLTEGIDTLGI